MITLKNKIKNKLLLTIIILFLILIISISTKVILQKELKIDYVAYNILVEKLRNPHLTIFMKEMTKFSDTITILLFTIILIIFFLIIKKNKKLATLIPCNLIVIVSINQLLKFLIQRQRPNGYRLIEMNGYSFPSGHAMVSMAFYGLLIYIIKKIVKNKILRNILVMINIIIIILIGLSRVYLGVHYFSDVITGYSISLIYLILLEKVLEKNKKSLNIP